MATERGQGSIVGPLVPTPTPAGEPTPARSGALSLSEVVAPGACR
jgi:hypothetical protein